VTRGFPASDREETLHRYLENGLEAFLTESRFAPLASLQVWVKAGSIDEEEDEAGIAHVLEHMLFKGSTKFPEPGGLAALVESAGGDVNAYTTFDHTVYYMTVPSDFVAKGTELLLDTVFASLIDAGELARELEVIREEIRRGRDNPSRIVSQNLFSALFGGTRFARPVIGFEDVVEGFTREKVRAFYERWYVPNNMTFIAAGDFNKDELHAHLSTMARTYRPSSVPERTRPPLAALTGGPASSPVSIVRGPYQEVRFQIGCRAPTLEDAELAAWEMFASVLGHGDSSRLAREVRDEMQLVLGIDSDVYSPRYPAGMFNFGFYGKASTALEAFSRSLQEIDALAKFGPQPEELARVLNTVKAERVYARESVEGVARTAGLSLMTSLKMDFEDAYVAALGKVTPPKVREVAQSVLRAYARGEYAISLAMTRESGGEWTEETFRSALTSIATSAAAASTAVHSGTEPSVLALDDADVDAVLKPYVENVSITNPDVRQWLYSLPEGRELHFNWRRSERLPLASLCLTWRAGHGLESADLAGLGTFVSQMLTRGTRKQGYKSFVAELEDHASSISAFSSRDIFGIRLDALEENAPRTLEMLLDALFRPGFEPEEFSRLMNETKDVLVAQRDSPGSRLARLSSPLLYGNHAYGFPSYGTEESLANITLGRVQEHWARLLAGARTFVVSCAGRFPLEDFSSRLHAELLSYVQSHPHAAFPADARSLPPFPTLADKRVAFGELEREQAHIGVNVRGLTLTDPRRTALELAANILGGQGGRLFMDLRDKRSLAYSVSASQSPGLLAGVFSTYIATASHKAAEAVAGLKEHIEALARELVGEDELARAKASVLGSQAVDAQHLHTQASQLAMSDVYGLGFDNFLRFQERVKAVTREDILAVMRSILAENPPVVGIVGPKETWVPEPNDPILKWNLG
jgi:zinc protease